jgi:cell division transport system permease protein
VLNHQKLAALFGYHLQAISHSLNELCRKPLANLMTILVIAIALSLPSLFWVVADNLEKMTTHWQHAAHVSLYLEPQLTALAQEQLLEKVRGQEGVDSASLKSAADGLAELTQQEGMQDIMRYLPENPLPAIIEVIPKHLMDSPAQLDLLSRQLETLPGIAHAKWDLEWIHRLQAILQFAKHFSHALMSLLALTVLLIIANALRLTAQKQQEEIYILRLIGATNAFLLRPFLYTGIWYGILGAVIAVLMVNIFILSLGEGLNQLTVAYQMQYPFTGLSFKQIVLLTLFAAILGWIAARIAVARQIRSIEAVHAS